MTSAIIASFIMMLVAASLGFAIAWVFKSEKDQANLDQYQSNKALANRLKEEQESIIKHSNTLQSEKLKLTQKTEKQAKRIQSMKEMVQQLEATESSRTNKRISEKNNRTVLG